MAQLDVSNPNWLREWERAWQHPDCRSLLLPPALSWLGSNLSNTGFPHVWRKVHELAKDVAPMIIEIGLNWLRAGPSSRSGWGFVLSGVARAGRCDESLVTAARKWLDPKFLRRNTWPLVWRALWDLHLADRQQMLAIGQRWLMLPDCAHPEYSRMWCSVWDASPDRRQLLRQGWNFVNLQATGADRAEVHRRLSAENSIEKPLPLEDASAGEAGSS